MSKITHATEEVMLKVANSLGYSELQVKQKEAISYFFSGNDVFISLPTGSGKSLCYIILPRVFDEMCSGSRSSIVIVVSPLVVLMRDQVKGIMKKAIYSKLIILCLILIYVLSYLGTRPLALTAINVSMHVSMQNYYKQKKKKINAIYVGDANENDGSLEAICDGNYQLVFFSPESLLTNMTWRDIFGSPVYQKNLVALVVDKACCVKKWLVSFLLLLDTVLSALWSINTGDLPSEESFPI